MKKYQEQFHTWSCPARIYYMRLPEVTECKLGMVYTQAEYTGAYITPVIYSMTQK